MRNNLVATTIDYRQPVPKNGSSSGWTCRQEVHAIASNVVVDGEYACSDLTAGGFLGFNGKLLAHSGKNNDICKLLELSHTC